LQQNLLASFQHNTRVPVPGKKKINHPTFSTRDIDSLQHLQTLHGTLDNSSISVSQCLGLCETFVATGDWRVPIQNQETPWLDSRIFFGYATLLQIK
jgi:hypothetical protein